MAYKTDGQLRYGGSWLAARSASAVLAAESSTLNDANYPTANAIDCSGFETILVKPAITGGSSPELTVEALFRDPDAADGARWIRRLNSSGNAITTGSLAVGEEAELTVDGWDVVMLRVSAVTNETNTTAWAIHVRPGKRLVPRPPAGR